MEWIDRPDLCRISDETMDAKEREYPNLLTGDFWGIPFYASPDGRTLPRVPALTCWPCTVSA